MSGPHPARVIAIGGPTGTGKSELSLDLADRLAADGVRTEILNADAMQLYRGMDVGTAKLPLDERRGVPHHLLDVLDVTEEASVARYQREARELITTLNSRGVMPILVGGSGLYLSSVLFDFSFPGTDPEIRARLEEDLDQSGPGALHRRLVAIDPEAARRIGSSNGRRLVRALEVAAITGAPSSGLLPEQTTTPASSVVILSAPREELVVRLDARVERMWRDGLVTEVEGLAGRGLRDGVTASRAIGYAQALAQLDGTMGEDEAIADTQRLTRRYARRQVSWFRRYAGATVLHAGADGLVDDAVEAVRPLLEADAPA
ncbi:tRNA dimethylallyltransferase [Labedella gwakjiensis]|uniref:tRNA dimethylallyltransferase n=1 Tax=Labedella gwakjiensis TaxID=390269 RepID=A0A2P8GYM1_9MICO|nr:tRNA (adenosine(37)-N6)-dimethylallyltransferase MiaA [Labedella gwakjiensis]PSL39052.1 tRNA dimethylallyltransferase [Labedella gwakjiensis]RUQ86499.1 tRNA (adenosine(37)-N6)-dimethylallyltransferase MiaA [Labedella gwakjiensis]